MTIAPDRACLRRGIALQRPQTLPPITPNPFSDSGSEAAVVVVPITVGQRRPISFAARHWPLRTPTDDDGSEAEAIERFYLDRWHECRRCDVPCACSGTRSV